MHDNDMNHCHTNISGYCAVIKNLLLSAVILTIISCQTEKDDIKWQELYQTAERLKKTNQILKEKLEKQEQQNSDLSNQLKSVQNNLFARDKIEQNLFFDEKPSSGIRILRTGDFHGDEIESGTEQLTWYGLIKSVDSFELQKVKLEVHSRHDPVVDEGDESTGKSLTITDELESIILINGLEPVEEGEIYSVELKNKVLYPGESMSLKLGDEWTSISAYGTASFDKGIRAYILSISSTRDRYRTRQIFAGTQGFDDAMFKFVWAGDIDRDGAIDLIMDLSDHYNADRLTLFLSSRADKGQLLKRVAEFVNIGS